MGGLGPADRSGNYRRPTSAVADATALPKGAGETGRYWLVIGRSCPWAHRVWLVWSLRGLKTSLNLVETQPDLSGGRWVFDPPRGGFDNLAELYRAYQVSGQGRATVPVLVDRIEGRVVCNESKVMVELLNRWPADGDSPDLEPGSIRDASRRWRSRLQDAVNDGVYRCGFARNQSAYNTAQQDLFQALKTVNAELTECGPWLCGDQLSLADLCLFTTLIRWELVYEPLFGCSARPLWSLPALHDWRRRLYAQRSVAATCDGEAWRRHYFEGLFPLNPGGIVPQAPPLDLLVTGRPMAARTCAS